MTSRRLALAYFILVAGIVLVVGIGMASQPNELPPMQTRVEPTPNAAQVRVEPDDRPGLRSIMGQLTFRQDARTTGVSPDTLRFRFDEPVRIMGVMVSADIGGRGLELVEFAVGINQPVAYGTEGPDWLIHVSDANEQRASKIDEHVWFPGGFYIGPDDFVGIGAWLYNGQTTEQSVSPEVIIYYEWVDG